MRNGLLGLVLGVLLCACALDPAWKVEAQAPVAFKEISTIKGSEATLTLFQVGKACIVVGTAEQATSTLFYRGKNIAISQVVCP